MRILGPRNVVVTLMHKLALTLLLALILTLAALEAAALRFESTTVPTEALTDTTFPIR
jgi:hypothetical protein